MKKLLVVAVLMVLTVVLAASAFAVGPGKSLEWEKGGKVVFSGDAHKAFKCAECHPALFKMKKSVDGMTMKAMEEGKYCGACHNGTKAFSVKECAKCHKK